MVDTSSSPQDQGQAVSFRSLENRIRVFLCVKKSLVDDVAVLGLNGVANSGARGASVKVSFSIRSIVNGLKMHQPIIQNLAQCFKGINVDMEG